MPAIISNRMLLLFEVRCIAAWKIRWTFGWGDFAEPLEIMDRNFLVLGCGRRWRERKGGEDGRWEDERMRGDLSPGRWWPIPDHLASCQGQAINAALLWLLQTAPGYNRLADSVRSGKRCTRQRGDRSDEGSSLGHIVNIHSRYKHQKK